MKNPRLDAFFNSLLRYWYSMNAGAVRAGAHSLYGYISVAVLHSASKDAIPSLTFQQVYAIFLVSFGLSALKYLDDNPLPDLPDVLPAASAQAVDKPTT
jgi:hypothetical protein